MLKDLGKKSFLAFFLTITLNFELIAHENDLKQRVDENVTLNFNNINISTALQYLSELNNNNLIIDDKIQGKLSIYLHDINWEQALDSILQTQGLARDY